MGCLIPAHQTQVFMRDPSTSLHGLLCCTLQDVKLGYHTPLITRHVHGQCFCFQSFTGNLLAHKKTRFFRIKSTSMNKMAPTSMRIHMVMRLFFCDLSAFLSCSKPSSTCDPTCSML
mmetsp:Transcript_3407/g.21279  ORF Transcript_3407/g.21279 Transcript_3407/m.21279 type:complete len:117 (+) Transcript_3407:1361-1711(+)